MVTRVKTWEHGTKKRVSQEGSRVSNKLGNHRVRSARAKQTVNTTALCLQGHRAHEPSSGSGSGSGSGKPQVPKAQTWGRRVSPLRRAQSKF